MEDAVNKIKEDILSECHRLKAICKNYNLVNELNSMIYQLKQESQTLSSTEARQTADTFIKAIEEICDQFKSMEPIPQQPKKSWWKIW